MNNAVCQHEKLLNTDWFTAVHSSFIYDTTVKAYQPGGQRRGGVSFGQNIDCIKVVNI